jgi:hypothetical protein
MNIAFYKLQVSGDDYVLIDRDRPSHAELPPDALAELASAILDRRRGVGGHGAIFIGGPRKVGGQSGAIPYRVFLSDGSEDYAGGDALLCAARWAFDSGRAVLGKIRLVGPLGERTLTALDSRTFALELEGPFAVRETEEGERDGAGGTRLSVGPEDGADARIGLIVDGRAAASYLLSIDDRAYSVAVAGVDSPGPKRVRTALAELLPAAAPVVVRPASKDLVRFVAAEGADRVSSAAVAVAAAVLAGRAEGEAAAEWRGRGGAVAFANFGTEPLSGIPGGETTPGVGTAALVDRGRFWVEWKRSGRIFVAGLAEYSFEGNYDYYLGATSASLPV